MAQTNDISELEINKEKSDIKSIKRKKKRSANQMAKKFMRKKIRDSDNELDYDTYQYLIRILEVLRTEFSTMDDKLIFVNNVYDQTTGRELEYARNQVGSRVMDSLMNYASFEVVKRLADALNSSLRRIFSDKYGSHVLETLIYVAVDRGNRGKIDPDLKVENNEVQDQVIVKGDDISEYNQIALKLCKYAINNIEEFIYDNYANHVLRTVVDCLGGFFNKSTGLTLENDSLKRSSFSKCSSILSRRAMTAEYTNLLIETADRLLKWPQFREFGKDNLTSGFLQVLLCSLKDVKPEMNTHLIKKIMKDCFTDHQEGVLSNVFDSESSLRLLETILMITTPKRFAKIYAKYFQSNVKQLVLMKNTNYTIQRLCDYCITKELFEKIFDELSEHYEEILERQHTGVLLSIANACHRLQIKQGPFVNSIFKALKCVEPEKQLQLVPVVARLITYDQLESAKTQNRAVAIHLHGSLIVQAMLHFNKPIKIVNSLLAMSTTDLENLFTDPRGSRILDAFMESKFVGEKSREKLTKLMSGHWVQLARSVHGSRCLDKFWQLSKMHQQMLIMEELAAVGQSLSSSKSGRLIYNKLNVALFARNKKLWSETLHKEEKTQALFANIIGN